MAQKLGAGGSRLHCLMVNPPLKPTIDWKTAATESHFYRATARNATHGIAVAILSVRPSDACIVCDKIKQRTANILIPHETAITLVF